MSPDDKRVPAANANSLATTRRTQRVHIVIPIIVSGGAGIAAFRHTTKTETVSAHGCLLRLDTPVARLQELSLFNPATRLDVRGTVVFVEEITSLTKDVGIEFTAPSPLFWGISFPPEDWDPSHRKLPPHESRPASRVTRSR